MDTVDRIFALLDNTTMEQQEFAAMVGVSDDTASNWRRRKSGSYTKRLPRIAEVLNTTVEYLLTGKEADEDPLFAEMKEKFALLTDGEKRVMIEKMIRMISDR